MNVQKIQSITALNFLQEIVRPYLEARSHEYYFLVIGHEDKPHLCPSLGHMKQTNRKSQTIFEELQGEHQHWLIWCPENHPFSGCAFYTFISKYSKEWDKRRTDPATYSDCRPLFINYKISNYEFTARIFWNRNGRKILDWSHPCPDYQPTEPFMDKTDGFYEIAT